MSIGRNIRDYRKNKGMSQEDLAKAMRVDRSEIVNWENDLSTPDYRDLRMLANIFNVKIKELEASRNIEPVEETPKAKADNPTFNPSYDNQKTYSSVFKNFIRDDEEILWEGKPVYNMDSAKENLFMIPFGIFFFMFAMFWMVSAMSFNVIMGLFAFPFIGVGIFIAFIAPRMNANMKKNTYYAVTNKRVLRYIDTSRHMFNEIKISSIDDIGFTLSREGLGTITFNDSRNPYPYYHRRPYHMNNSIHHHHYRHYGNSYHIFRSFNNIPNAKKVYDIINDMIEKSNKA